MMEPLIVTGRIFCAAGRDRKVSVVKLASADMWDTIHSERRALAADVTGLIEPQWSTPSLCAAWTVRDVLAHMTATARMGQGQFIARGSS